MEIILNNEICLMSKVNAALMNSAGRSAKSLAFLVLPGSFCPVHSQHLRAMEVARDAMASLGWYVIGGFLAPSSDDYVRQKIGEDTWPVAKRLELCRLATVDSPWMDVAPFAEFSGHRASIRLKQIIQLECREGLQGREAIAVEVMGSDTAVRLLGKIVEEWNKSRDGSTEPWYRPERFICSLVRPGPSGGEQAEQLRAVVEPMVAEIGIKLILYSGEGTTSLRELSSHEIRSAIAMRLWGRLRDSAWLPSSVLEYLRSMEGLSHEKRTQLSGRGHRNR